jgi:exonuclease SbcC
MIKFPAGRTLLEGDIGSGKSSVLMGIEFALFGLGADSGGAVLRLGQEAGEVRMVFDVDGSEYEVTRRLVRKSGRVQQSDGYLRTPMETFNLSPSELKEKVLEVLEFNEAPDPKAQSWIYRYAVYTPQDGMKSVLGLASEQRLQILRRAFRVEDYKTAATNAEEAARQTRVDASRLDGISEGIEELHVRAEQLQKEEESHREELVGLEERSSKGGEILARLKAEQEELRGRESNLRRARTEKDHRERIRVEASKDAAGSEKELSALKGALAKAEASMSKVAGGPKATRPVAELGRREGSMEARVRRLTGLQAEVESKLSDYESIMEHGVCPVCDRPVEAHAFDERRAKKDAERQHVGEELRAAEVKLGTIRRELEKAESAKAGKRELALLKRERTRLRSEISRESAALRKFEKRTAFAKSALEQIGREIDELEKVVAGVRDVSARLARAEADQRKLGEDLVRSAERLKFVQTQRTKTDIEIVAKEDASIKSRKLKEREMWLADYFVPTLKMIEKSVLATINQEFDLMFNRWFGMLVGDPEKEVGLDEDFSPIITQGGYEQEVEYLSGGERTSVALAYRLALNTLAQRSSAGMKSNLLILDEPTDGFSKGQLGNVREVLDEIGSPQVIIVSHDKELESFADQIIRVDKVDGESRVGSP